jgi:hypothetical protein
MANNPHNNARRRAHIVLSRVGSLAREGWQAQAQFEYQINCSNWWSRFYTQAPNVQLQAIQDFTIPSKKGFIDGW